MTDDAGFPMAAPPHEPGDRSRGGGPGSLLKDRLPLETETAAFILANVLDIFVTLLLLVGQDHVEANPIARYFWEGWGLKGLAGFKLSMVALVCVIAQIVARFSTTTARRLLVGLTAVVGAVVIYSLTLLARVS